MSDETHPSVRHWLNQLGLAQYADSFDANAIDLDLLPQLKDVQLQGLGVSAMGHRIKLLRAAQLLSAPAQPAALTTPPASAERRQLTVMFCDLAGSTALSQQLDPEDLRLLMQRYQRVCGDAVARHAGHVAQYLGDGVMVYFGWPRAHEDDAQRALHAALEIVEAVKTIPAPQPLRVRVGVATGPVVVGETGNGDASQPKTAIGETPNLAARLQAQADLDQILVANRTRRLVADAFECVDQGEHSFKGIAKPVHVWRVMGEGVADGRFAAAHGARLTPMVNRDAESQALQQAWAQTCAGKGQALLLVGEPGIGKSRVVAELCDFVGQGSVVMRAQCSELHANSAFYPLANHIQRTSRIVREDSPAQRLDKIEAVLRDADMTLMETMPHLARLMSLPVDRYPSAQTSPQKQKSGIVDALVRMTLHMASRAPVVLVFEDLHWMDPTSLEVLDALVPRIANAPVLMVMTTRDTHAHRWLRQRHVHLLRLVGLNGNHSLELAIKVAVLHGLPPAVLQRIVEHTDGVPLFLEEVTRTLLDAGGLTLAGASVLPQAKLDAIEIPATLKDSLTARLDQHGAAKRCAQLGAVLGRQFRHDVVLALAGQDDEPFSAHMQQLVAAGLLDRSGKGSEAVYTFRHALIQDAAYETLLKSDRRALHARAGLVLAEHMPELAEQEPEQLARHHTAGEAFDLAAPLWLKAGQRAWQRSAAPEAIAHLNAGLAIVHRLGDEAARDSLELRLQSALGVVYFAAVSYTAPQARAAFERAAQLCERVPEVALKVPVLYGLGAFQTMKGDIRAGHAAFVKLLAEADAAAQPRLRLYSHSVLTWSHHNSGHFAASLADADKTLALYAAGAVAGPRLSAADPKIISECFRAASLWSLGHVDQARAASDGVLAHARALGDPYSLAYTLNFAALVVPERCGEHDLVLQRSEEGVRLARELGYPFLEVFGSLWRAWVLAGSEGPQSALAQMNEAMLRLEAMGVRYHHAQLLAWRARLLLRTGQTGSAQLEVAQALAELDSSGEGSTATDVYLAEGEVNAAVGGEQQALAEAAYGLALEVAREQGALSWELRAATLLARLWATVGNRQEARALLAPLLARFTEGHDTADHRQARELLATLH